MKRFNVLLLVAVLLLSFSGLAMAEEAKVTRMEFTKMALDLGKIKVEDVKESTFKDVKAEDISYVEAAYKNKLISGYGDLFKPQDPVTKEQAIIILVRALGEEAFASKMVNEDLTITDKDAVSPWAKGYVAYGLKSGILEGNKAFNPTELLGEQEAKDMMNKAKAVYDTKLTREGLTAMQMLDTADKKLKGYKTYKFTGKINMNGKVKAPQGEELINMEMLQEGQGENPETVYVKTTMTMKDKEGTETKSTSEAYMKDRIMYMKIDGSEKWIKMDMNPMMNELEGIMGGSVGNTGISSEQLKMFGMYAKYEEEATIDGKEYYVIGIDVDKESFKKIYKEIMDKTMKISMDAAMTADKENPEMKELAQDEEVQAQMQKAIEEMIANMDMELGYKLYIDKKEKNYDKMDMNINMNMTMEGIHTEMLMNGDYKYFDFDQAVKFPEIKESDIETME